MASITPQNIPIISLAPFLSANTSHVDRDRVARELYKACREVGFFYLVDHGIPEITLTAILNTGRQFFLGAIEEQKAKVQRRDPPKGDGARGYQKLGEEITLGKKDWHEGLDFYRNWWEGNGMLANGKTHDEDSNLQCLYAIARGEPHFMSGNVWPEYPAGMRELVEDYICQMLSVGRKLMGAIGQALRLKGNNAGVLIRKTQMSFWCLRLLGYPPLTGDMAQKGVGCGEHTDYGGLTLLLQDETKGALQVQLGNGEWIDVDPLLGAFVVNIADMMEIWTNGEWKSTRHRVVHQGEKYRVSMPFFYEPDFSATVEPLETCIERTGGRKKYEQVVYGEHLQKKIKENYKHDGK